MPPPPPESFLCPLTQDIMTDPVISPEGHSFERSAIESWLVTNAISPITRQPLRQADLSPNFALRHAIEEWVTTHQPAPEAAQVTVVSARIAPVKLELQLAATTAEDDAAVTHVLVKVAPPVGTKRTPLDICAVIDVSGSMALDATIKGADGSVESHGLTVLDVVKHAVRTIIDSLTPEDNLSLVAYSSAARTVLRLTSMTTQGKQTALLALLALEPDGSTNLWDGLRTGMENLREGSRPNRLSSVFLLTDGQPNMEPPRGHLPSLQRYKDTHKELQCSINTFGFGFNLDSALLQQLAIAGDGSYAFIPDSGFVGTIFVHALANLLATAARNAQLSLEAGATGTLGSVLGTYSTDSCSWGSLVNLGNVRYGQSLDVVVPVLGALAPGQTFLRATLRYVPVGASEPVAIEADIAALTPAQQLAVDQHVARLRVTQCIASGVAQAKRDDLAAVLATVRQLIAQLRASRSVSQPAILTLLEDLDGQVTEAFANQQSFKRWGCHFLPSLERAHLLQVCNNFKDPGVQRYGGALFQTLRDEVDDRFTKLPPPKPTGRLQAGSIAVRSMASYNNRSNPCFHGACTVLMADGSLTPVAVLKRGALVQSPDGTPARVECVIKTYCEGGATSLVTFPAGLRLTAYHPVRLEDGIWQFPLALRPTAKEPCDAVYSFVLDRGHVLRINGIECCTLGHGFSDNAVIAHPYLGTQRVVEDLKTMPGWAIGHIEFNAGCMTRERNSTLTAGFSRNHMITTSA